MDTKIGLENLILARDMLAAINIPYFLTDGTLLGLVRNGRFIDSDTDVDIGVFAEDFNILSFGLFAALMKKKGFSYRFFGVWGKYFAAHWMRQNVTVDVGFYFRRGGQRITYAFDGDQILEFSYPAEVIESLSPVALYGEAFMAPKQEKTVLSRQYGRDWTVPRTDWDWKTSPFNITDRKIRSKWDILQGDLSTLIIRLSGKIISRFIPAGP